jgi:hypothetical protein
MARSIRNPINVVRAVTQVREWEILEYQDSEIDGAVRVLVRVAQDAERPYAVFWLHARDARNSTCLFVNPAPESADDQLLLGARALPNARQRLATAYAEAGGDHAAKLAALEPVALAVGLLDAAFG